VRVTSKGQVTIPKPIRDSAGIGPGTEVEFENHGEAIVLRRAPRRPRPGKSHGEKVVEALRGTATRNPGLSTDEIMKLLRGDD
jgi:antitoxin PrlF